MLSYFAAELDGNAKQGVRNEVSQPKLLQGDLAEAWREADGEFATVAMRFSVLDATVEKASGRLVSGSASTPQEATEVWTFRRPLNGTPRQWELSAIQQA
jgi:predicted lipid-binding transport protein (Tim44 family)